MLEISGNDYAKMLDCLEVGVFLRIFFCPKTLKHYCAFFIPFGWQQLLIHFTKVAKLIIQFR